MLNQPTNVNWDAVLARLNNVHVDAGVSPIERMGQLLEQAAKQALLVAQASPDDFTTNNKLHAGLSHLILGLELLYNYGINKRLGVL